MIYKNCFEIINKELFFQHMRGKREGFNIKQYQTAHYILHAYLFKDNLSKNNLVYQDDYYYADENMNLIEYEEFSSYRRNVWKINHNTVKYLLRNNIIIPIKNSSMALISLLYK